MDIDSNQLRILIQKNEANLTLQPSLKLAATPAAVETECRIDGPLSDHD